ETVGAHVTTLRPEVADQINAMKGALVARGADLLSASDVALHALAARVARQGAVLAYEKVFLLQAVTFLVVLPLLFFLRAPKSEGNQHIELPVE
ncbi:MAG TPA: hypothetical protein VIF62_20305, partial [Labilithrix sp.]